MNRRQSIKTIALGSLLPAFKASGFNGVLNHLITPENTNFNSEWHNWYDMKWIGPEYWANRLQDWNIINGKARCIVSMPDRNLQILTIQKRNTASYFKTSVGIEFLPQEFGINCRAGFRLGAKGIFEDYRSAAVFGKGIDIGLDLSGNVSMNQKEIINLGSPVKACRLEAEAFNQDNRYFLRVTVYEYDSDDILGRSENISIKPEDLEGNIALLAHAEKNKSAEDLPLVDFSAWNITGEDLLHYRNQIYGPICFAQYTVHNNKLKLTTQLTPFEDVKDHKVILEIKKDGQWVEIEKRYIDNDGRALNFVLSNWRSEQPVPYRIKAIIPLRNETRHYTYDGTISAEPKNSGQIKLAVFSCNFHYGFPDADVHKNVSALNPDVALFLGDQFYEGTGGFGVQYSPYDKACLDYLRKWMMFGWSYREIFRHIPCAIIPDDHDVFHGNVWGEEGKAADTSLGYGSAAQDTGGYKMPAKWVNMVQFTQTSHLPDPYDPTPIKQGIGVYYTQWKYAGISFAIIEDRKFKSAPSQVLPKEADVFNGFSRNRDFNIKEHKHINAELLGKRQEDFLEYWTTDWKDQIEMKVLLSQTNFGTVATLPEGSVSDAIVPSLVIPEKGEYVKGDMPTADMDSNGWPSEKRDKAIEIIRKCFAFHIAGDQHLASMVKYGVEEFGDSGYAFAGPALNNIWPRRWWPPVNSEDHTYNNPSYTGDHFDGFGNRISVIAAGNPFKTNIEPAIIHDRATGYGLVTINKNERTIRTDCWPRYADPIKQPDAQFPGWPVIVKQEDGFTKKDTYYLPKLTFKSKNNVVVQVNKDNTMLYCISVNKDSYSPKVFEEGKYDVIISNPETDFSKVISGLKAKEGSKQKKEIHIELI